MECKHPVIVGGKCLDCGAEMCGMNKPTAEPQTPAETPENAVKTEEKKTARRKTARK